MRWSGVGLSKIRLFDWTCALFGFNVPWKWCKIQINGRGSWVQSQLHAEVMLTTFLVVFLFTISSRSHDKPFNVTSERDTETRTHIITFNPTWPQHCSTRIYYKPTTSEQHAFNTALPSPQQSLLLPRAGRRTVDGLSWPPLDQWTVVLQIAIQLAHIFRTHLPNRHFIHLNWDTLRYWESFFNTLAKI